MSTLKAFVAGLVVFSYAGASLVPCEASRARTTAGFGSPQSAAMAPSAGHGDHGHGTSPSDDGAQADAHAAMDHSASGDDDSLHTSGHGDCHEPPSLMPRCTCGCDEKSRARAPGGRLGPALLAMGADGPAPARAVHRSRSPGSFADTPLLLPEPIPI